MKFNSLLIAVPACLILSACGGSDSNKAPVFDSASYSFSLSEDSTFSGEVSATDSDPITYTITSAANNGILSLQGNGDFTYTPNANFYGQDTVSVQASDGSASSIAQITFLIANVNDAPVINTSPLLALTENGRVGQIQASDADGDSITYAIVEQPESGTIALNPNTGEFDYNIGSLEAVAGQFTISYTDGILDEAIEATINLQSAYVTNADKLNYYYSSDQSHLKQAEAIKQSITDDSTVNDINASLGLAYAVAGFTDQAEVLFNEITTLNEQAEAYNEAGESLEAIGQTELAARYRQSNELLFAQYIAEKGIRNLSTGDFSVLLGIYNNYINANDSESASATLANFKIYASVFLEDVYTTQYGFMLGSIHAFSNSQIQRYLSNKTDENRARALNAIRESEQQVRQAGYSLVRRGEYQGLPYELHRVLRGTWVAEQYFYMGANEEAKDALSFAMSMYGLVGLDSNYPYEASPYSVATLDTYVFSLPSMAGLIAGLYPELDTNPAFALLSNSFDIENAQVSMLGKQMSANILAGESIESAVQPAADFFITQGDYQGLYETLVQNFDNSPGAAQLLFANDNTPGALALLTYTGELINSEAYIDNILTLGSGQMSAITGRNGCIKIAQLQQQYGADASSTVAACSATTDNYLSTEAGKNTTNKAIEAYRNIARLNDMINNADAVKATAIKLQAELDRLANSDNVISAVDQALVAANDLLSYGAPEEAKTMLFKALDQLQTYVQSDPNNEALGSAISMLSSRVYIRGFSLNTSANVQETFLTGMANYPGTLDNYALFYADVIAKVSENAGIYTTDLLARSEPEILEHIENLIVMNAAIGDAETVNQLLEHSSLSAADVLYLKAQYASFIARKNDFLHTNIASIDTDNDGMPNFFISSASESDILASGLIADTDADNDGIPDADDPNPLIADATSITETSP